MSNTWTKTEEPPLPPERFGLGPTDEAASVVTAHSGTKTAGASAQLLAANPARRGVDVTVDMAASGNVYLLLGIGTASATNFHYSLGPGGNWNGEVGAGPIWNGAVQFFGTGQLVGVVEV